jgi:UDP-N-acetyl-2-amino-2-deoxyglucuronate dehydrogenase
VTRVAVIGCGTVSVVHRAAIEAIGAELVGVCDIDPARAPDGYRDHRAMLDELRPEVVHICTPHDQHVPIAIDALDRGAHVLLEKPVAHTVEEAERLVAAAAEFPERKIGVCLQNRYNATSVAAKEYVRQIRPKSGSATVLWHRDPSYYGDSPWRGRKDRSGGGVLINQAIHTIDLLEWLLGDVIHTTGHIGEYGDFGSADVEDTAYVRMDHAGGARSILFATITNATDSPVTIEIVTDEATLVIRKDLTITYADGRTEIVPERRAETGGRDYWGFSHELLIADFYRSLDRPEPFWIGPSPALRSQRIVDQIYRHHS